MRGQYDAGLIDDTTAQAREAPAREDTTGAISGWPRRRRRAGATRPPARAPARRFRWAFHSSAASAFDRRIGFAPRQALLDGFYRPAWRVIACARCMALFRRCRCLGAPIYHYDEYSTERRSFRRLQSAIMISLSANSFLHFASLIELHACPILSPQAFAGHSHHFSTRLYYDG